MPDLFYFVIILNAFITYQTFSKKDERQFFLFSDIYKKKNKIKQKNSSPEFRDIEIRLEEGKVRGGGEKKGKRDLLVTKKKLHKEQEDSARQTTVSRGVFRDGQCTP